MEVFSGASDFGGTTRLSHHLLLLPQSVLPRFFSRSSCLCKRNYKGETSFPFILQNIHRYFLYLAVLFLAFLWYDAYHAFFFIGRLRSEEFGVGLGSLIMLANVTLLTLYTFSCHSLRHLAGGKLDCFSCSAFGPPRHTAWSWLSRLNERHMLFAWASLISVGFTDFYIRMLAAHIFTDLRVL